MTVLASGSELTSSSSILASGYDGGFIMSLASGTRVSLSYQEELTTRGVPEAVVDMTALRATGRNINPQINTIRSQEVRSDRQVAALRHGFNQVVGSPGFELSLVAYDDFIEAAMSGTWAAVATAASQTIDVTISAPGKLVTFTRTAGDYLTDGFLPGMVVQATGLVLTGNDGLCFISSVTALAMTCKWFPDGVAFQVEAGTGDEEITMTGKYVQIGTTLRTYTIERAFNDVAQYQVFNGCAINQMSMNVQPEQMVGGTFDILGMSAAAMVTSPRDSTVTAAAANDPFSAFDGALFINGQVGSPSTPAAVITGLSFSLNNNRTLEAVVGSKFSPDVFEGTATITGEVTAFFEDENVFNLFINETISSLFLKVDDLDGTNFMVISFPAIKYTGGDMDPPQQGPVPIRMPFEAQVDATHGHSFMVQRSNT